MGFYIFVVSIDIFLKLLVLPSQACRNADHPPSIVFSSYNIISYSQLNMQHTTVLNILKYYT